MNIQAYLNANRNSNATTHLSLYAIRTKGFPKLININFNKSIIMQKNMIIKPIFNQSPRSSACFAYISMSMSPFYVSDEKSVQITIVQRVRLCY